MHHFFVDPSEIADGIATLTGDDAHHAAHVLRIRAGETISIADGTGSVMEAIVTNVGKTVEAEVREARSIEPLRPAITICQGIAKGERMDVAVEKLVEIGVIEIVPFMAERSVVRWDPERRSKAVDRWNAIAKSAAKQSRSAWLPTVRDVNEGVAGLAVPCTFALHEKAGERLRDALPEPVPESVTLVVGPEGGLTDDEVSALMRDGASVVSLGERILRTETAGLVAAAAVFYHYGSLG